ncbi:forkhead-associated (FHA) domain-containing protein [Actinidia rufa]|uniref:Forkhead-associated (FHA) domain-containing protein n=1 Tax=Actinidia rufa TaxID=165716 RepID=A0A7J0EG79_9ERIC|nr:forkhead-associated (FHA) domain-containing protein [Actinidia rufa]
MNKRKKYRSRIPRDLAGWATPPLQHHPRAPQPQPIPPSYPLRFSEPSSQILSVTDLSSVHGTWVSGKKIEPGVRVELNEGDTMQLGGSRRVYNLHWVPLSHAYYMETPFVSQSDVSIQVGEEEEEEETHQNEKCLFLEDNQIQSSGHKSEGVGFEFSDENSKSLMNNVIPLPDFMNSLSFSDEVENKSTSKKDHEHRENSSLWSGQIATGFLISSSCDSVPSETESQEFGMDNQISQPYVATELLSESKNPKTFTGGLEHVHKENSGL